ncbi:MAG: hypothetical protein Q8R47_03550 [Nanoarchaeota archaeon]|nr:hypothetical protein [Nanoarchaeota archaeon]
MKLETILQKSGKSILSAVLPMLTTALTYNAGCSATSGQKQTNSTYQSEGGNGGTGGQGGNGGMGGEALQCIPHATKNCFQGDVYWNNSCDQLEDLYQQCNAAQKCENATCVDKLNCPNNIDLIAGCQEQGCQFYDTFKNQWCLWDVITGLPTVVDEKLMLTGTTLLKTKNKVTLPQTCNSDFRVKYTVQPNSPDNPGSYTISLRDASPESTGVTFTQYSAPNNKIYLACNGGQVTLGDFDLKSIKNIEVQKKGDQFDLYLENVFSGSFKCNNVTKQPITQVQLDLGSAVAQQNFTLDDITLYCNQ